VRSRAEAGRVIRFEALTVGDGLSVEEFVDGHGNHVCRSKLARGTNCVRHDAILSISSVSDHVPDAFAVPTSQDLRDLPVNLLRYTLPSRYCDSD